MKLVGSVQQKHLFCWFMLVLSPPYCYCYYHKIDSISLKLDPESEVSRKCKVQLAVVKLIVQKQKTVLVLLARAVLA